MTASHKEKAGNWQQHLPVVLIVRSSYFVCLCVYIVLLLLFICILPKVLMTMIASADWGFFCWRGV